MVGGKERDVKVVVREKNNVPYLARLKIGLEFNPDPIPRRVTESIRCLNKEIIHVMVGQWFSWLVCFTDLRNRAWFASGRPGAWWAIKAARVRSFSE